jgi:hypothetical protein
MGKVKDKSLETETTTERISYRSTKESDNPIRELYSSNRPYTIVATLLLATLVILWVVFLFLEKPLDGPQLLLLFSSMIIVSSYLVIYLVSYNKRVTSKLIVESSARIAELEKNQREIMEESETDNLRSLRIAKIATQLEFAVSRALDLDVMIASEGKLVEIGADGKERIVGETETSPKTVTKRRFIIGD